MTGRRAGDGAHLNALVHHERGRYSRALERLLSWDFDKLILSHGECLTQDAKAYVKHAFRWLDR